MATNIKKHKTNMELAKKFTLFNDTFMSVVFDGNTECTSYLVSTILGKKLKVVEAVTQKEIKNLKGRSVRLDIKAVDSKNRLYNIEVQREEKGAKPRRARYNGSLLDSSCEDSGEYGEKLPETYVIFITEKDYWKLGKPLYSIERKFTADGKEFLFDDGLHIIYVNGEYKGNDRIGDLMHDFSCEDPKDMKSKVLRQHVAPYKTEEGEKKMRDIMELSNKQAVEDFKEEMVMNFLKENIAVDVIARATGVSKAKILKIQKNLPAVA